MICPRCGNTYDRLLALSRKDNKTHICDQCGMEEALEDFYKHSAQRVKDEKEENK